MMGLTVVNLGLLLLLSCTAASFSVAVVKVENGNIPASTYIGSETLLKSPTLDSTKSSERSTIISHGMSTRLNVVPQTRKHSAIPKHSTASSNTPKRFPSNTLTHPIVNSITSKRSNLVSDATRLSTIGSHTVNLSVDDQMFPTSRIESEAIRNDDFTGKLIDTLASKGEKNSETERPPDELQREYSKEERSGESEEEVNRHHNNNGDNGYEDGGNHNKHNGDDNDDDHEYKSHDSNHHNRKHKEKQSPNWDTINPEDLNYHPESVDHDRYNFDRDTEKALDGEGSYHKNYGDNKDDHENYGDEDNKEHDEKEHHMKENEHNSAHSPSKVFHEVNEELRQYNLQDPAVKMNLLDERDMSNKRSSVKSFGEMNDALMEDTDLIRNEIGTLRREDAIIGGSYFSNEPGNKSLENIGTRKTSIENTKTLKKSMQMLLPSSNSVENDESDDVDMDKATSELLNIDVGADGKILDGNIQRSDSKESVLSSTADYRITDFPETFPEAENSEEANASKKSFSSRLFSRKNPFSELVLNSTLQQALLFDSSSPMKKKSSRATLSDAFTKITDTASNISTGNRKTGENRSKTLNNIPTKLTAKLSDILIKSAHTSPDSPITLSDTLAKLSDSTTESVPVKNTKLSFTTVKDSDETAPKLSDETEKPSDVTANSAETMSSTIKKANLSPIFDRNTSFSGKNVAHARSYSNSESQLLHEMFTNKKRNHKGKIGSKTKLENRRKKSNIEKHRSKKHKVPHKKNMKRFTLAKNEIKHFKRDSTDNGFAGENEKRQFIPDDVSKPYNYVNKWRASRWRNHVTGLKRQKIHSQPSSKDAQSPTLKSKFLTVNIKSIGCFDPPFHGSNCSDTVGSILVNNVEMSQNLPGFNFVVVDLKTGNVEQALSFDTHGQAGSDARLEKFLGSLDLWKIVCIAVKDDAKTYLADSVLDSFTKIGANLIATQKLEVRSSYAFVGLSGPENARSKVTWIREEHSKAGDGPSTISVSIETGYDVYNALGGSELPNIPATVSIIPTTTAAAATITESSSSTPSNKNPSENENKAKGNTLTTESENKASESTPLQGLQIPGVQGDPQMPRGPNIITPLRSSSNLTILTMENTFQNNGGSNNTKLNQGTLNADVLNTGKPTAGIPGLIITPVTKNTEVNIEENLDRRTSEATLSPTATRSSTLPKMINNANTLPTVSNMYPKMPDTANTNPISSDIGVLAANVSPAKDDVLVPNAGQQKQEQEQQIENTIDSLNSQQSSNMIQLLKNTQGMVESSKSPSITTSDLPARSIPTVLNTLIPKIYQKSQADPPHNQFEKLQSSGSFRENMALLQSLRPSELAKIIDPGDPAGSLLDIAKNIDVDGVFKSNSQAISGRKKSTADSKPSSVSTGSDQPQFLAGLLDNVNKLKAQLQMQLMSSNTSLPAEAAKLIASPYTKYPDNQTVEPSDRSVDKTKTEESFPEDTGDSSPAMDEAADISGSRNVGESRLASALSALGLPDAGATGIASLMIAGFIAAGDKQKKEAALKLGLAAKLSKSIADLGGRGAASAAGLASLNELIKDGLEIPTVRLADQIGQALQRVGGAGAAVGYSALASSLKAIGDKPKPGALVGGIVLALAEQGSAPGTAGLAALAAGLGGSGADALAGGLGGALPNVIAASQTNNYMTGGGGSALGHGTLTGTSALPGGETSALVGGGIGVAGSKSYNTDAEYTGQGPAGSTSQAGLKGNHYGFEPHHFQEFAGFAHGHCRDGICGENDDWKTASLDKQSGVKYGANGASTSDMAASVTRSATVDDGRLPVTVGGGELVNTDNPEQPSCQVKRGTPPECLRLCSEKKNTIGRLIDLQSGTDKAAIKINGEDFSKDQDGLNLVIIDFNSGQVEASEVFDTEMDPGAGSSMKNFLTSLGQDKVILGATKGNAGEYMFNGEYRSLNDIGIRKLIHLNKGDKYVFLASKGKVIPEVKEELNETPDGMAEIIAPLVVGPGASTDICQCIKSCKANQPYLPSRPVVKNSESAYADVGAGDNIAGQKRFYNSNQSTLPNGYNVNDITRHQVVVPKNTERLFEKVKERNKNKNKKQHLKTSHKYTKAFTPLKNSKDNIYNHLHNRTDAKPSNIIKGYGDNGSDGDSEAVITEMSLSKVNVQTYKQLENMQRLSQESNAVMSGNNKKERKYAEVSGDIIEGKRIPLNEKSSLSPTTKCDDVYGSIGNSVRT